MKIFQFNKQYGGAYNSYINDETPSHSTTFSSDKIKGLLNSFLKRDDAYTKQTIDNMLASSQSVRQEETLPETPNNNTLYYIGTEAPYQAILINDKGEQIPLGTSNVEFSEYQKRNDDTLETETKNVVGAINGINAKTKDLDEEVKTQEESILAVDKRLSEVEKLFDLLHPVGCIIMQSVKPSIGTWTEVTDTTGRALWLSSGQNFGTTIGAGLPNITGSISCSGFALGGAKSDNTTNSGALKMENFNKRTWAHDGATYQYGSKISMNASWMTNSLYGKSSTVQPNAYVIKLWKRTK